MASVSASHLIIFIASIVIAAGVAGTLTSEVGRLSGAIDDIGIDLSNDIRTDIEIISDEGSQDSSGNNTAYSETNGNVTLHLKNTGSRTLQASSDAIDIFLDGEFISRFEVSIVDANEWREGDVVKLEIDTGPLSAGDHRIKVIVGSDEEVFEFRIV